MRDMEAFPSLDKIKAAHEELLPLTLIQRKSLTFSSFFYMMQTDKMQNSEVFPSLDKIKAAHKELLPLFNKKLKYLNYKN